MKIGDRVNPLLIQIDRTRPYVLHVSECFSPMVAEAALIRHFPRFPSPKLEISVGACGSPCSICGPCNPEHAFGLLGRP